jgi:3-methyl-2-oxobutanoate hydroxymethyltransferase
MHDMLGLSDHTPRFVKNFMDGQPNIQEALRAFVEAVKTGEYPGPEHSYK